jgi:radical SAM protein with 4Fe4S-binding SPASM domain
MFEDRIYSFYNEIKEINKGNFPYPRFLALYPTNMCQFNCTFCDYKELNSCKPKYLEKLEWKYILDIFKNLGGEAIGLAGGGEPLMLPTISEFLTYSKKLGLKTSVVTNGLNINKVKNPELYEALFNCSFIRVSFEAGSPEVFKKIKGKDYFNQILRNVSEFIKDKPDKLQVSYKYTISSDYNYSDIIQAIKLADDLGFYSIQLKGVSNSKNKLSKKDRDSLKSFLEDVYFYNTKVIIDFDHYTKCDKECKISAIQTLIDYYGDIYICCYYRHRPEEMKIGNIFQNKFEDIWRSEEHKNKITNIDCDKCNLYDCRYIRYEQIMKDKIDTGYFSFI